MLMKTKEGDKGRAAKPTMSMKTSNLKFLTYDVYENKCS